MLFDLKELSVRDGYKLVTGLVVPRPIALVTTVGAEGVVNAAPFSFFNLVGADPPLVVLGAGNRDPLTPKDTPANIRANGEFVVNVVDEAMLAGMNICAVDFPAGWSEPDVAGLALAPGSQVKVPRLAEAPASLECREHTTLLIGRNRVTLGQVVAVWIRDDLVDAQRLHVHTGRMHPIGRMGGAGGYTYTRDGFEMPRMDFGEWQNLTAAGADLPGPHPRPGMNE